jgi:hypothetical protein
VLSNQQTVTDTESERVRRYYDRAAPQYDAGMRWFERLLLGDARGTICSRAHDRTLELGVGTGLNLAFFRRMCSSSASI